MNEKPHRGRIRDWYFVQTHANKPPHIEGLFLDHPELRGNDGHTAAVLKFDAETGEIETRNSRYTLVSEGEPSTHSAFPRPGDKVLFLGRNGYDHQLKEARKVFLLDHIYTVESCDIGPWSSTLTFVGIDGSYNSVMFEPSTQIELPLQGAPDGTRDPQDEASRTKD
jgi:hypothetical protein